MASADRAASKRSTSEHSVKAIGEYSSHNRVQIARKEFSDSDLLKEVDCLGHSLELKFNKAQNKPKVAESPFFQEHTE